MLGNIEYTDDNGDVNIFTPIISADPNSKRALMLWPHGGSNYVPNPYRHISYPISYIIMDKDGNTRYGSLVDSEDLFNVTSDLNDRIDTAAGYKPSSCIIEPVKNFGYKGTYSGYIIYPDYKIMFGYHYWDTFYNNSSNGGFGYYDPIIKFPTSFDKSPYVTATIVEYCKYAHAAISVVNISTTSFQICDRYIDQAPENAPGVFWIAIGK